MKQRTKAFALRVIKLVNTASNDFVGRQVCDQLLRSGTSVVANHRSACRAKSKANFINKLGIIEEEADESALWIELMSESRVVSHRKVEKLLDEANQIAAMMVASRKSLGRPVNQKSRF